MGMGGGTILILCLSLFCGMNQHIAQATNLVFFVPTSCAAIYINWKQKLINWKIAIPICLSGCVGAFIGSIVSNKMDVNNLKKYFGYFLALIAIIQIYTLIKEYIIDKKRDNKNMKIKNKN